MDKNLRVLSRKLDATSCHPSPTSKKRQSRYYDRNNGVPACTSHKKYVPKKRRTFKFDLEVPKTWKDRIRINDVANNKHWHNAVAKEIYDLIHHTCSDFKYPDFKPSKEYQHVRLHLVYDVKTDLTPKVRLVCDGSQVDPRGLSTRTTSTKWVPVRLLDIIADSQNFKVLIGIVVNVFIQAHTKEKIITRCGTDFGEK